LTSDELKDLRSKISTTNLSAKSRSLPKAFTEKGLYMLATILKSQRAKRISPLTHYCQLDSCRQAAVHLF